MTKHQMLFPWILTHSRGLGVKAEDSQPRSLFCRIKCSCMLLYRESESMPSIGLVKNIKGNKTILNGKESKQLKNFC